MRLARRFGAHRGLHDLLRQPAPRLAPAPFGDVPQALRSALDEPIPPQPASVTVDSKLCGDPSVAMPLGLLHDDAAALHHLLRVPCARIQPFSTALCSGSRVNANAGLLMPATLHEKIVSSS
jgi:hypothetical protein